MPEIRNDFLLAAALMAGGMLEGDCVQGDKIFRTFERSTMPGDWAEYSDLVGLFNSVTIKVDASIKLQFEFLYSDEVGNVRKHIGMIAVRPEHLQNNKGTWTLRIPELKDENAKRFRLSGLRLRAEPSDQVTTTQPLSLTLTACRKTDPITLATAQP